ncbi:MAG TPA: choice-of-anchor D domain-containing protein [Candidatus Angelobacter sp.]|nr:choice-of-anchor D domain-containing protein [Candidatus Angelobacter sp.]
MSPSWRGRILLLLLLSICSALPSQAQVSQATTPEQGSATQAPSSIPPGFRVVPFRDPNSNTAVVGFAAPAGAHLQYFGGPVISNVQIVEVLYGNGSYLPQVAGTVTPNVGTFFSDITGSSFMDMLSEYNTTIAGGTNQVIGHGTFVGLFTIIPSAANNGTTISDAQIQSELLAQINAGHLPSPVTDAAGNVNTLYMIYFPPGKQITLGGSNSCQAGGFCAFHGTTTNTINTRHVLYGVHPDMQAGSGCDVGCGNSTVFNNVTSVSSHEFSEAVTDADVGIATTFGPPLAWMDQQFGEIGDICNGQQGQFNVNGTTYTVQLEFSNRQNNCILPPANVNNPNFTLSASPASVSVNQGSSASSTITVTPSGGFTSGVSLSASGLPAGVTATFGANPATSTSSVTFTASSTATTGTSTVTVTGVSGALTHTTTISLTVNAVAAPNFSLSASPASVSVTQGSSANSTITVTPSGGFTGSVSLSASGLPAGVTATFGTNPTTSTSVVTFTASSAATTGTSTVTITGTSGALTHTTTISLTVNAVAAPNFSLSASPASVSVTQGSSANSTITVTPSGGFTGSVSLSASGLPAGVTASFGVNPTTSTSAVTLTASSTATTGTSTVTITGTSGALTHTTAISLTVNAAGGNGGAVTLTPASLNFGTIPAGTATAWQPFTLKNTGTTTVSVTNETVSAPFVVFSQCGTTFSLSAGANCTIYVMFEPTTAGSFTGTLTVTDSAGTQTSSLSGTAN